MTSMLVSSWAAAMAALLGIPAVAVSANLLTTAQALKHLEGKEPILEMARTFLVRRLHQEHSSTSEARLEQKRLLAAHGIVHSTTYNSKSGTFGQGNKDKGSNVSGCSHHDGQFSEIAGDLEAQETFRVLKAAEQETEIKTELDVNSSQAMLLSIDGARARSAAAAADWSGEQLATGSLLSALTVLIKSHKQIIPGVFINSLPGLVRVGECGNHRCELGELVCFLLTIYCT
jgi:hypothetical protein